jgi:hypothetical protein
MGEDEGHNILVSQQGSAAARYRQLPLRGREAVVAE